MDAIIRQEQLQSLYAKMQADPSIRSERMGSIFVPGAGCLAGDRPVLIGEAPGREEEGRGEPFVGQAGRNLEALLGEIGWSRSEVFITNLVKYRPIDARGGNRSPTLREGRSSKGFLLEEMEILQPLLVVCLGLSAARILLGMRELTMGRANGSCFFEHGHRILVTYHPSPFNYHVPSKRQALRTAFARLKELSAG